MMFVRRMALFGFCTLLCLAIAPTSFAEEPGAKPLPSSDKKPLLKSEFGGVPGGFEIPGLTGGNERGDVGLTASFAMTEGTNAGTLRVRADITPGWHTFSMTLPKGATGQASVLKVNSADMANLKNLKFEPDRGPIIKKDEFSEFNLEEYEDHVTWSAPIVLMDGVDPKKAVIEVKFSGQVCKESCVPIRDRKATATFAGYLKPPSGDFQPKGNDLTWKAHLEPKVVAPGSKAKLVFEVTPKNGYHFYPLAYRIPEKLDTYPTAIIVANAGSWRKHAVVPSSPPKSVQTKESETQKYYDEPTAFTIDLDVPKDAAAGPQTISGVLIYQTCLEDRCNPPGGAKFEVTATVGPSTEAGKVPVAFTEVNRKNFRDQVIAVANSTPLPYGVIDYYILAGQLGLALVGGILLNFMPCVLPVLGLKILNFAQQGGKSWGKVLALNLAYAAGLLTVFLVLATLSAFLNVGWGQQFTHMWFKLTLFVMTFAFALSFLGVWEIPIPGFVGGEKANSLQQQEGFAGAFFKGIFTTILGVSCSGPFLGGVFGYTLTQIPLVTYLIFICVGVGMASPFLVIAVLPQTQKLLPKPGEWMNTFKHVMGFVMLGVVVYLFSTLDPEYYIATLAMSVGVGFGLWWIGQVPGYEERSKQLQAWGVGLASAALIGFLSFQFFGPVMRLYDWRHFSQAELTSLQKQDKTVMVDFTATWCPNCHWNFRYAINTNAVKEVVEKNGVIAVEADWTKPNPELEAKLTELNSQSIPVLAIYPAGRPQDVIILRDLVTKQQVVEALEKAGPSKNAAKGETAEAAKKKPRAG
jgi:suppressor for copper-sensitivity B